ncbi:MAG: ATP-binding protein [Clostridia bacterium]|nr:ATP-binding protein [Clostridia bacterium]
MIERPLYMERIEQFIDAPLVKIITGIRRCGKSTILEAVAQRLIQRGVPSQNIIYAKLDSYEFEEINSGSKLYHEVCSRMTDGGRYYLLLDEVQEIPEWEKAVNSLIESKGVNIFVTGSNSKLMSSEISTYLTGRYVVIPVYTLSFSEYITFRKACGEEKTNKEYLANYIKTGGFPAVSAANYSQQDAYTIVRDIYNSVIFNDIVKRGNIRKVDQFERIVKFAFENVGKTFSAQSVCAYMKSEGRSLDIETVYNYLQLLQKAYILYKAERYNIQGKAVMRAQEKYYLADPSLKYAVLGYYDTSVSSMIENIVYLEFLRRGYQAYVGYCGDKEIDFVGILREEKVYVQVCRTIPESANGREREVGNLEKIKDNFPKYIVVLDDYAGANEKGIKIIHLADFLLKKEW